MRNHLILAAAPLALLASPASAQDATGTVSIDGSVAARCLFTTPSATISLGEMAQSGTGNSAGTLDTSKVDGKSATLVGWCNSTAATMTVQANALTNGATAATGFTNRVDYSATANANSVDATDDSTDALPGAAADVNMFSGDVQVTLSNSSATGLLVAGGYSGSVEVVLSPTT
ncbi:hypothetical protein [Novosphingobium malaysiense]|uniref:Spore coat protein U domain-containing protein n=1 Tax=Novosphingobium malaysiense TaxID=1348853 RepID=A0A0B1ZSD2_9SPHN|nr:hypothetical protein [Novosphingobium malaysiense]KHK93551.1 hypothetical protein LK12_04715 [Novosphingobium malaysiense]